MAEAFAMMPCCKSLTRHHEGIIQANRGEGILEGESCMRHLGGVGKEIIQEGWRKHPGGIEAVDSWLRTPSCGLLAVDSWL